MHLAARILGSQQGLQDQAPQAAQLDTTKRLQQNPRLGGCTTACRSPQQVREQRKSQPYKASGSCRCQTCVPPPSSALHQPWGKGGWVRLLLRRAWGSALLDVPPVPSPLLLSAGSKVEAKPAAVQASALWQPFHSLKAVSCCLLQWEALGQAGEKEKGQVPLLTLSGILASPGHSPGSEANPKPCHPEKPHARHHLLGRMLWGDTPLRAEQGWGRSSIPSSIWLQSEFAELAELLSGQQPSELFPTGSRARHSVRRGFTRCYIKLHPWSGAWIPALPMLRWLTTAED